jgi:hypothetical protein
MYLNEDDGKVQSKFCKSVIGDAALLTRVSYVFLSKSDKTSHLMSALRGIIGTYIIIQMQHIQPYNIIPAYIYIYVYIYIYI